MRRRPDESANLRAHTSKSIDCEALEVFQGHFACGGLRVQAYPWWSSLRRFMGGRLCRAARALACTLIQSAIKPRDVEGRASAPEFASLQSRAFSSRSHPSL